MKQPIGSRMYGYDINRESDMPFDTICFMCGDIQPQTYADQCG